MGQINRHRAGNPRPRKFAVDSAQVIEAGDMVFQSVDDARAASQFSYVTSDLPGTQANFRRDFMGIALTGSASGETDPVSVGTAGEWEMDCAAATFEIGDLLGPDDNGAGDTLLDQQVIAIGENGYGGVMRAVKRYGSNTTRVVAEILPEHMRRPDRIEHMTLFNGLHTSAADLVTDLAVQYPFKAVALVAVVTVATTGAGVITIDKDTTGLDDTLTVPDSSGVGTVVRQALDDATGDDRFEVGDNLTLKSDGNPSAGEILLYLEIRPFLHES